MYLLKEPTYIYIGKIYMLITKKTPSKIIQTHILELQKQNIYHQQKAYNKTRG